MNPVYSFQISYLHGKSTYLPYTVGTLIANSKRYDEINEYYDFKEPIFIREEPEKILLKIDNPCVCAFSNYIWNHEFNKVLAEKIKEKYPDCIIIFGGHQISTDSSLLEECPYIDILIFGEGEETFARLLLTLKNKINLSEISNIAFRNGNELITTKREIFKNIDFPSPYLTGIFDSILENYPELTFYTIIETNRGCPYGCTYCDWGSGNLNCEMRLFPEEKVFAELDWLSEHKIHGFGFADSNFGMFERDEKFVDHMVKLHNKEGILKEFQTSYAKNSNERVFSITKKLNDCGMNKGATISFQSMSETVLENIHRKNISTKAFTELMEKYNKAGIATYSELILGLPGETLESLTEGIDTLLNAGQHNSIYIHNCEWLPFAPMGDREYIDKFKIKTVKIPLNQPHRLMAENEIMEYSQLVVETESMSREDWVKMNILSATVQSFHHEGLLMMFALYLHYEKGVGYSEFYTSLINYFESNPDSIGGKVLAEIKERFSEVSNGNACPVFVDEKFGKVGWPVEEYLFLSIACNIERFYEEITPFLRGLFTDDITFEPLMEYQKKTLKLPFTDDFEFEAEADFREYFYNIICGNYKPLNKVSTKYKIPTVKCNSWEDYARYIVWYGRKDSRNIYLEEIATL